MNIHEKTHVQSVTNAKFCQCHALQSVPQNSGLQSASAEAARRGTSGRGPRLTAREDAMPRDQCGEMRDGRREGTLDTDKLIELTETVKIC